MISAIVFLADPPFFFGSFDGWQSFAVAFGATLGSLDSSYSPGAGVFERIRLEGCGGLSSSVYWVYGALAMSDDLALGFALGFAFGLALSS